MALAGKALLLGVGFYWWFVCKKQNWLLHLLLHPPVLLLQCSKVQEKKCCLVWLHYQSKEATKTLQVIVKSSLNKTKGRFTLVQILSTTNEFRKRKLPTPIFKVCRIEDDSMEVEENPVKASGLSLHLPPFSFLF
ncbi:hypothetical protein AMTRI_Chr04g188210 [Amborella trichopoda]